MQIKTINYLFNYPLGELDLDRYGINYFNQQGIQVNIYNITCLVRPLNCHYKPPIPANYLNQFKIKKYSDLENTISMFDNKDTLFICCLGVGDRFNTMKVYKILSGYSFMYVREALLVRVTNQSGKSKKFKDITIKKVIFYLKAKIIFYSKYFFLNIYYKNINQPEFAIALARNSVEAINRFTIKPKSILLTHSFDYENFLKPKKNNLKKHIVYLDEYMPFHPDWNDTKSLKNISNIADEYYKKMNNLFDVLENKFSKKVIVAAHPRADIQEYKSFWNGREFYFGKTDELCNDAIFCINHASGSVALAVLYKLPVLFITMSEISFYEDYINLVAAQLNLKSINIDNIDVDSFNDFVVPIDEEKYAEYKEYNIKCSESLDIPIWENVYNYLKSIKKEKYVV